MPMRTPSRRSRPSLVVHVVPWCLLLLMPAGCQMREPAAQEGTAAAEQPADGAVTYRAELQTINAGVGANAATGTATLSIEGDQLTIIVDMQDAPPNMMHLQHYHGFVDGRDATCAGPEQDTNADGIVDLIETQEVSGITLVPFHKNPAGLNIAAQTYPTSDAQGRYTYRQTVQIPELRQALQQKHQIQDLILEKRVVYVHGVSPDSDLPDSVQSLPDVPAHVTLPIACGKLERVE
jgi:hypothetical protein